MSRVRVPLLTPVKRKAPAARAGAFFMREKEPAYQWPLLGTAPGGSRGTTQGRVEVSGENGARVPETPAVLVGERYALMEPIGRGGMADVYRSVDQVLGRTVAVKVLRDVTADESEHERFMDEA